MAHGRHRRATPRKALLSLKSLMAEVDKETQFVPLDALLTEQNHMIHDGDDVEQTFNLMACVHPAQCTCEAQYPYWKPGQR